MGDPWLNKKICFVAVAWFALAAIMSLRRHEQSGDVDAGRTIAPRRIYSIDEAFCDLTGVRNCRDLLTLAEKFAQRCYNVPILLLGGDRPDQNAG